MAVRKREKRKRAYIPYPERLAAALAMLLPADQRDALRAARAPAEVVLRLFHWDHYPVLHTHGGSDKWHNLNPLQIRQHREKSRGDTSIVAKVDRIIAREQKHKAARHCLLDPEKVTGKEIFSMAKRAFRNPWPKRKIPSRPFRRSC